MSQTMTSPRRAKDDLLLSAPQPGYISSQPHSVRAFVPSAWSATTFTDANVDATAVGKIVVPEDGTIRGHRRMIVSVTGTTATIDKAWPVDPTGSATTLSAFVPAAPYIRATSDGNVGKTTTICTDLSTPDNYADAVFITGQGYYLIGVAGTNAGAAVKITSYDHTTQTFTHAAWSASKSTAGDLYVVAKLHRPEGDVLTAGVDYVHEPRPLMGSKEPEPGVIHDWKGTPLGFALAVRPLSTAGSAGAVAPVEAGDLLSDIMTASIGTGTTCTTNTAGPPLVLHTASGAGFNVSDVVLNSAGEAGLIVAKSTNDLTIAPGHMTAAKIANTSVLFAGANYTPKITDWRPRTFYYFRSGKKIEQYADCLAKLSIAMERAKVTRWKFDYPTPNVEMAHDLARWVAVGASQPLVLPDTTIPTSAMLPRCLIDSQLVRAEAFNVDVGLDPKMRAGEGGPNQSFGSWMDTKEAGGALQIYADNNDISGFTATCDRVASGIPFLWFWQRGSAATRDPHWCRSVAH